MDATVLAVRPGLGTALYSDGPGSLESLGDRSLFAHPCLDLVGASAGIECRLVVIVFRLEPPGLVHAIACPHDWHRNLLHQGIQPLVQAGRSADDALPGVDHFSLGAQLCDLGAEWRIVGANLFAKIIVKHDRE